MSKGVPFVDLGAQQAFLRCDLQESINDVVRECAYIGIPGNRFLQAFEDAFSQALGGGRVLGVANGTDALEIGLTILGVGPGDEVIVPAMTWISTAEAVVRVGATPVFSDVDLETGLLDIDAVSHCLSTRTRAVVPVHLYGMAVDIDRLRHQLGDDQIGILEDCAQAHLAEVAGRKVGTLGDVAAFSFYPGKNLGAIGDAGAVVCHTDSSTDMALRLRNHGQSEKHYHHLVGRNSRMDGLQAAVLTTKLPHLEAWTSARIERARLYCDLLSQCHGLSLPPILEANRHVYHLFVVRASWRDALRTHLKAKGIGCGIHYPTALSDIDLFARSPGFHKCPKASEIARTGLSLPMFPELSMDQQEYVARAVMDIASSSEIESDGIS